MYAPVGGAVTPTTIDLSWSDLLDQSKNGGDNPIYYRLEWYDQVTTPGSPQWVEISSFSNGKQLS